MRTQPILGLSALLLLCAVAVNAQQTYDGRNGPHVYGSPGEQVYIRGQNEGPYQVPDVPGTFQNSPAQRSHVYTDEQGNTYVNQRQRDGRPGEHRISGPNLVAQRGQTRNRAQANSYPRGPDPAQANSYPRGPEPAQAYSNRPRRTVVVSRPDRVVISGGGGTLVGRRDRRDIHVSRPDRVVISGGGDTLVGRRDRRDIHVSRPDRTVDYGSDGSFILQRDGRVVAHSRQRRDGRVIGKDFAARGDQACIWNGTTTVCKRPDGRTVSFDKNGNYIASGSPNGRTITHQTG